MLLLALGMLSACGNVSRGISGDGVRAKTMVWPDANDATPMHRGGTFPNADDLRRVRTGVNKQQIANLIGFPHFSEGVWDVREWNYVFNFHTATSDQVVTCQFKILFDENKLARSFYWRPESCASEMDLSSSTVTSEAARQEEEQFTLSSDALFGFNRFAVSDITDEGRAALDRMASTIKSQQGSVRSLHITGYTDRLGDDSYNDDLSLKRAFAVMDYLTARGVSPDLIEAEGLGKRGPIKDCPPSDLERLIACLAPNRRVEVRAQLMSSSSGTGRGQRASVDRP
jgi:OOP family OmpA-OmpF porin